MSLSGGWQCRSDQFRQYAEEATLWVSRSKNEEEKQILIELLCTWTAAAVASDALGSSATVSHKHISATH